MFEFTNNYCASIIFFVLRFSVLNTKRSNSKSIQIDGAKKFNFQQLKELFYLFQAILMSHFIIHQTIKILLFYHFIYIFFLYSSSMSHSLFLFISLSLSLSLSSLKLEPPTNPHLPPVTTIKN